MASARGDCDCEDGTGGRSAGADRSPALRSRLRSAALAEGEIAAAASDQRASAAMPANSPVPRARQTLSNDTRQRTLFAAAAAAAAPPWPISMASGANTERGTVDGGATSSASIACGEGGWAGTLLVAAIHWVSGGRRMAGADVAAEEEEAAPLWLRPLVGCCCWSNRRGGITDG